MPSADVNIMTALRELLDDELRGTFTASVAIVEDIDYDTQRAVVSLKEDEDVFIDNVPIGTMHARDGEGIIYPLEIEDEGLLIHTREPLYNKLQQRGPQKTEVKRHHTLNDAVFLPQFFFDTDDTPPYEPGQFRVFLKDEPPRRQFTEEAPEVTEPEPSIDFRLDPYAGEVEITVMDGGEEMVSLSLADDGTATIENDTSTLALNPDGLLTLNGAEVVVEDAETNDTFLGFGGNIEDSGQE